MVILYHVHRRFACTCLEAFTNHFIRSCPSFRWYVEPTYYQLYRSHWKKIETLVTQWGRMCDMSKFITPVTCLFWNFIHRLCWILVYRCIMHLKLHSGGRNFAHIRSCTLFFAQPGARLTNRVSHIQDVRAGARLLVDPLREQVRLRVSS